MESRAEPASSLDTSSSAVSVHQYGPVDDGKSTLSSEPDTSIENIFKTPARVNMSDASDTSGIVLSVPPPPPGISLEAHVKDLLEVSCTES